MEDVDEAFDSITLAEERFHKEGFEEGVTAGKKSGVIEGTYMGIEQGGKIGSEIGFYYGFAQGMKDLRKCDNSNKRASKALASLQELIEAFPLNNPQDETMHDKLENIRAKFKQISAMLKINSELNKSTDMSF